MPIVQDPRLAGFRHRDCSMCSMKGVKTPATHVVLGTGEMAMALACEEHKGAYASPGLRVDAIRG